MDGRTYLRKVIEDSEYTVSAIEKKLEFANGTLRKYLEGITQLGVDKIAKISTLLPQIDWNVFIKGDLKLTEVSHAYLDGRIVMSVPLVNQYAYAGYMRGYGDATYIGTLPKVTWTVDREYKGDYMSFEVKGDSMDDGTRDSYVEGDLLLCREIHRDLWVNSKLHIRKWKFVIAHKTEGLIVKKIIDHDTHKGTLKLHSLNNQYPDFEVNVNDIYKIFNVVKVERTE